MLWGGLYAPLELPLELHTTFFFVVLWLSNYFCQSRQNTQRLESVVVFVGVVVVIVVVVVVGCDTIVVVVDAVVQRMIVYHVQKLAFGQLAIASQC